MMRSIDRYQLMEFDWWRCTSWALTYRGPPSWPTCAFPFSVTLTWSHDRDAEAGEDKDEHVGRVIGDFEPCRGPAR